MHWWCKLYRCRYLSNKDKVCQPKRKCKPYWNLDEITIDEGSGDELELVGKGNHNVSYNTTGNNIIMSQCQ